MKINFTNAFLYRREKLLQIVMRTFLFLCFTTAFSFSPNNIFSQNVKIKVANNETISVHQIFELIQQQAGYKFVYSDDLIVEAPNVELKKGTILAKDLLKKGLLPIGCTFEFTKNETIIVKRDNSLDLIEIQQAINGTVTDQSGVPLLGAAILEKGTVNGVQSDFDGNFSLETKSASLTIVVSYIGFKTQEIIVTDVQNKLTVILVEAADSLDEIVVTALGIKRERKELGYSFQDVKGDAIANNPTLSVAQSLYGKVSGVSISQTAGGVGASSRVVIRGNNSINGDNQPLYIVDGVPLGNTGLGGVTDSKAGQFSSGIDNGDGLSSINLDDIENISVLKGGAASALYGERGANGVIVITTKKGKKNSFKINWNSTTTFDVVNAKYDDYQTSYGSGTQGRLPNIDEISTSQGSTTTAWGPKLGTESVVRIFDGSFKPYERVTNNIQGFFKTGVSYNNNFSLSGGGDNTTYRFSYGKLKNEDVIPNSGLERNSFSLRATTSHKKLSLDGKLTYTTEEVNNRPALADDANNIGFSLAGLAPNIDQAWLQHYEDGSGNYYEWNSNNLRLNPYYSISENSNVSNKNRILGNFNAIYKITDWLSVAGKAGIDRFDYNTFDFLNAGTSIPGRENGGLTVQDIVFQEYNIEASLLATKQFGKFGVSVGIGGNHRKTKRTSEGYLATDIINEGISSLANFSNKILGPKTSQEILVKSLFSYLRTNYNDYLFLDLTARNDWNSTLATATGFNQNNNYSFFYPSVSSSFVFSKALNISPQVLNFGKIRASWASTGKAPENPYATTPFYSIRSQPLLGQPLGLVGSSVVPNGKLKPEISDTFEVGADLSFFKNRLSVDFSYYKTKTKNQLIILNTSQASGFQGAWTNVGLVENKGIEALVSAKILRNPKGFNWNLTLNYSKNNNTLISLTDDTDIQVISNARWAGAQIVAEVGNSSSEIYGKKFLRSPDGQVIVGANGLPQLTETFESLGKAVPDWIMGISNEFSYKGFSLKTSLDMRFGGNVYSMTNAYAASSGLLIDTVEGRDEYNAWIQQKVAEGLTDAQINALVPDAGLVVDGVVEVVDGDNITYQKNARAVNPQDYWRSLFGNDTTPEPFIYDASYVKLRELSIGYSFPRDILESIKIGIDQLRVSFVGRNLWTIYSNIPNIDPEATYTSGNGQGFEYGSLPYRRSYGVNIQVSF
ncbi:MAG: SusC/RagA family TonB-linked outer membrane protein [Cellulophaga sp.]